MYEDYLEEFVFKTAKLIAQKLFGKKSTTKSNDANENDECRPLVASTSSGTEDVTDEPINSDKESSSHESNEAKSKAANVEDESDAKTNVSSNEANTDGVRRRGSNNRIIATKTKSSLDAKIDNPSDENNALVKCNTYDLLCNEMSDEIAEAEKIIEEESNRVITKEGMIIEYLNCIKL